MRLVVALALIVMTLAGCSESSGPAEEEPAGLENLDLEATEDTGVIRGVVVDETFQVVAGATIIVTPGDLEATSDEDGVFGFQGLEPGTYFLSVSAVGFNSVQQSVEVVAGISDPKATRVLLTSDPGSLPYSEGYQWRGHLGCTVRVPTRGQSCPFATTIDEDHNFIADYELPAVPDWVVSEMYWKSTQQLGGEMSFNIRRDDTNSDTTDVEGRSPLALTVDREMAEGAGFGVDSPLRVIVFTAHLQETEPPVVGGWGVGAQIDQDFDVYTHMFYNYVPDQEWRFLEDSNVPQP